jgi:hypothetical protein
MCVPKETIKTNLVHVARCYEVKREIIIMNPIIGIGVLIEAKIVRKVFIIPKSIEIWKTKKVIEYIMLYLWYLTNELDVWETRIEMRVVYNIDELKSELKKRIVKTLILNFRSTII